MRRGLQPEQEGWVSASEELTRPGAWGRGEAGHAPSEACEGVTES